MFTALFETTYPQVMAFARRRSSTLADAEEVVSETFIVAWRRMDDLPNAEDERAAWLLGVARRVLANQRRSTSRRGYLMDRLRSRATTAAANADAEVSPVVEALHELRREDQEILRLRAWEGLTHAEIAVVMGITENAAAIRLHRARKRLAARMRDHQDSVKGTARIRTWIGWKGSAANLNEREDAR